MRTADEVKYAFTAVGKLDTGLSQRILRLEIAFRELASEVFDLVPESADRTAALRKLLESKMTCVQAISHYKPTEFAKSAQETTDDPKKGKNK